MYITLMNNAMNIEGAVIVRETAKAYMLRINGCSDDVWLPKSQLSAVQVSAEDYNDGCRPVRFVDATIPAWLAAKLPWTTGPVPYATRPW